MKVTPIRVRDKLVRNPYIKMLDSPEPHFLASLLSVLNFRLAH
jgi:hypothetical protein